MKSKNKLKELLTDLIDKKLVLEKAIELIKSEKVMNNNLDEIQENDLNGNKENEPNNLKNLELGNYNLKVLAGVISIEEEMKFKRMIFRVTKGIAYPNVFDVEINEEMANHYRIQKQKLRIFLLILPSDGIILNKTLMVCDLFKASRYKIPSRENYDNEMGKLYRELDEKRILIQETENSINKFLNENSNNVINLFILEKFSKIDKPLQYFFKKRKINLLEFEQM